MTKKRRFMISQAINQGLSETINMVEHHPGIYRHAVLSISKLELDPENPRKLAITLRDIKDGLNKNDIKLAQKQLELESLQELAATIERSGIINPIVVYKHSDLYRIVAGERRYLASQLLGSTDVETRIFNEKPQGYELKLIQWVENTARVDLTLYERLCNIRDLLEAYREEKELSTVTATILKHLTGLSLPQASYYLAVLQGPTDVLQAIECNMIRNLDKAAFISGITAIDLRKKAIDACHLGTSLSALRTLIKLDSRQQIDFVTTKPRVIKRKVTLGQTESLRVVKTLIQAVLAQPQYALFSQSFSNIDWTRYDHATTAFKRLMQLLEGEGTIKQ